MPVPDCCAELSLAGLPAQGVRTRGFRCVLLAKIQAHTAPERRQSCFER